MADIASDSTFVTQVRMRAKDKAEEITKLRHDQHKIEMQMERATQYLDQLNTFLASEGQRPELVRDLSKGSVVGKPGNRAKDFPVRKAEWEGMSLFEAVKAVLETTPTEPQHADVIAHMIYEIESPMDLRRVKASLVSTLLRGAKEKKLWEFVGGNKYKAARAVQERLESIGVPR
jgi:hypothetical protein